MVSNDDGVWERNGVVQINISDDLGALNDPAGNRVKLLIGGAEKTFI